MSTSVKNFLADKCVLEVSHITEVYGPTQALSNYLKNNAWKVALITHPFSYSTIFRSELKLFMKGQMKVACKGPVFRGPEFLHYVKDFVSTFLFIIYLKTRFNIYIGVNNFNALIGVVLRKLGIFDKVIFYSIDYTPFRFENPILNSFYNIIDLVASRSSDYIWNLSKRMAEVRIKRGADPEKNLVVPVGVELDKVKHTSSEDVMRKTLVVVSHLAKSKGIQLIIESMPEILRRVPNAKLLIIGTGPYENALRKMVRDKGLEKSVRFLGTMQHKELFEYLPKCGIGLATYVEDPKNITVYADPTKPKEYMACGLSVVITKVAWIAREIEKNKAGIAINYDKGELVKATVRLLTDDELFESCRKNAIRFASKLDWAKIYDKAFSKCSGNRRSEDAISKVRHQRRIYDEEFKEYSEYKLENWRISYINRLFNFLDIRSERAKNDTFLDVGVGGSGYTVIEASQKGLRAVGIDISTEAVKKAHLFAKKNLDLKSYDLCEFLACSATSLPFRDRSFSKGSSIAVLEHIPDDTKAIKEISRVMKRRGSFFVTVPNAYRRILPIFWIPYAVHDRRVGHLRHYRAESLVREFMRNGLDLKRFLYHANLPKVLQYLLSLMLPSLRIRSSEVWWKLEELDHKFRRVPTGLNFSLVIEKQIRRRG